MLGKHIDHVSRFQAKSELWSSELEKGSQVSETEYEFAMQASDSDSKIETQSAAEEQNECHCLQASQW